MRIVRGLAVTSFIVAMISLAAGELRGLAGWLPTIQVVSEYVIIALIIVELVAEFAHEPFKPAYLRRNVLSLSLGVGFAAMIVLSRLTPLPDTYAITVVVVRSLAVFLNIFGRVRRLSRYVVSLAVHPARTILLSFLIAILVGMLFLMMPFSTVNGRGLTLVNALFTSTSAVCVTGLVVVDTATALTFPGQIVVVLLIQIGGLGIMLLSLFTVFSQDRRFSLQNRLLISYAMNQDDMSTLDESAKSVLRVAAAVEGAGALLLYAILSPRMGFGLRTLWYAIFHSVSAFCNAGFALFSDSLESFRGNVPANVVISLLIILGGISFAVIGDVTRRLNDRRAKLSVNSRVVLATTAILIVLATLLIYATEHGNAMKSYSLGEQYLAAFFQAVTLRTAGFNTIPFDSLRTVTYLIMIAFMFVGGASGSTAGGIKVNTVAVLFAHVRSTFRNRRQAAIFQHTIVQDQVMKAFLILLFGVVAVGLGTLLLSVSETQPLRFIAFEAVSAFGTVGLSAGITSSLSVFGRLVIITLMYLGRLGPLTVFAAASQREQPVRIEYPQGAVTIG